MGILSSMFTGNRRRCNPKNLILLALISSLILVSAIACTGKEPLPKEPAMRASATPAPSPQFPPFEGKPVVVYVVGPLSGENAQVGQAQAAGARLAADQLNRAGGLLGREILVKALNGQGEPEAALAAKNKVADAVQAGERVIGVVVHEGSDPQLLAATQVYLESQSGIDSLVIVPSSTALAPAAIDDQRFFRLSASSLSQAGEIAKVFQEQNLHGVVVVHTSTTYGKTLAREFNKAVDSLDVTSVATFEIPSDAASYGDTVDQIRELNPSALFFAAGPDESAVFLSELLGLEFQSFIVGSDRSLSYTVVDELGCQSEGINFASVLPEPSAVMSSGQMEAYAALEGRAPDLYSVAGYSSLEFIVQAYERTGILDAGAAASQARQSTTATLVGDIAFDAGGQAVRPKVHFLKVQSRLFEESFAMEVGAPPQTSEQPAKDTLTVLNLTFAPDKQPIVFAGLNWNSAQFANSVARTIIEAGYGYPTSSRSGASAPLFRNLASGQVQVYLEGWLPNLQVLYDEALAEGQIEDIGLFYGNAVLGWFIPRYVVEGDVARGIRPLAPDLQSVEDLAKYRRLFESPERPGIGQFIDGSSGWVSYKINCRKLKTYQLDSNYAQIATGSEGALFARLSKAYEDGEPVLLYMWEPTWTKAQCDLIQLGEPDFTPDIWKQNKGVAYPLSQIRKLVYGDLQQRAPEVVEFLGEVSLSSEEISRVLLTMKEKDQNPEEAAVDWLRENKAVWSSWVPAGVA